MRKYTTHEPLRQYYELGLSDVKIAELLKEHYDTEQYGLRYSMLNLEYTQAR
jgi:hypothetical protein